MITREQLLSFRADLAAVCARHGLSVCTDMHFCADVVRDGPGEWLLDLSAGGLPSRDPHVYVHAQEAS